MFRTISHARILPQRKSSMCALEGTRLLTHSDTKIVSYAISQKIFLLALNSENGKMTIVSGAIKQVKKMLALKFMTLRKMR